MRLCIQLRDFNAWTEKLSIYTRVACPRNTRHCNFPCSLSTNNMLDERVREMLAIEFEALLELRTLFSLTSEDKSWNRSNPARCSPQQRQVRRTLASIAGLAFLSAKLMDSQVTIAPFYSWKSPSADEFTIFGNRGGWKKPWLRTDCRSGSFGIERLDWCWRDSNRGLCSVMDWAHAPTQTPNSRVRVPEGGG